MKTETEKQIAIYLPRNRYYHLTISLPFNSWVVDGISYRISYSRVHVLKSMHMNTIENG